MAGNNFGDDYSSSEDTRASSSSRLTKRVASLESTIGTLDRVIQTMKTQIADLETSYKRLKGNYSILQENCETLEAANTAMKNHIKTLKAAKGEHTDQVHQAERIAKPLSASAKDRRNDVHGPLESGKSPIGTSNPGMSAITPARKRKTSNSQLQQPQSQRRCQQPNSSYANQEGSSKDRATSQHEQGHVSPHVGSAPGGYAPQSRLRTELATLASEQYVKMLMTTSIPDNVQNLSTYACSEELIPIFKIVNYTAKGQPTFVNEYCVKIGKECPHLGAAYRLPFWKKKHSENPTPLSQKEGFESTVLEMSTRVSEMGLSNRRAATSSRAGPGQVRCPLPRYIFEVGELFIRTQYANGGQDESRTTDCHVIMDVTKEEKPLWVVYRYRGFEHDQKIKPRPFDRDDGMFPFVHDGDQGFDVAKMANSIGDWLRPDKEGLQHVPNAEGLIKSTNCQANPIFSRPQFDHFIGAGDESD